MTDSPDLQDSQRLRLVLAAVDDSSSAALVIRQASEIADGLRATLHVVRVVESLGLAAITIGGSPLALPSAAELLRVAREDLQRHVSDAQLRMSGTVSAHLRVGSPWREIVQLATDLEADLLVIGTHDAKGFERLLLGSRAEMIVRSAPCPVLVARRKVSRRSEIPEILPPCPDCLTTRRESGGTTIWCARHEGHHKRAHTYSEAPETFGAGSQQFKESGPG